MNNNRHFGISRALREKTLQYSRQVAAMPVIRCRPRFPWASWSWQMAGVVSAAGALIALWFGWYQ